MAVQPILVRWEVAKNDFERITGKKKPKPDTKLGKAFNYSGLTGAMKDADKALEKLEGERDQAKKAKLLGDCKKLVAPLHKAGKTYVDQLEKAVKDEIDDKGEKTDYAKGLKFLGKELQSLCAWYDAKVNQIEVAADDNITGMAKAVAMVRKSLTSTLANAISAVKKVKAEPTPAAFNAIYNQSDNPMRKLQVQLIAADNGVKRGLLPTVKVDPRAVADKLTPWQAQGRAETKAEDDEDKAAILKRLGEMSPVLKMAAYYADDLAAHG